MLLSRRVAACLPPSTSRGPDVSPADFSDALPAALADAEVVLVSYRSRGHVEALLSSWPDELRVVLVDNSKNADGIRELEDGRPSLRYVDGHGQGFSRSANLGARTADATYVLFVNPDSRPSAAQLAALVEGLSDDPLAAAHAGTPTDQEGKAEVGSGGWEPSLRRVFVYSSALHKLARRSGFFAQPEADEQLDVDWVCGACMAVRRTQFLSLGGFDEAFYVYAEDMSFGRRARRAGLRSVLRTDVMVLHGAGSSGAPSLEMLRLRGASFAGYVLRYHPRVQSTSMRAVFAGGAFLRAGLQLLRGDQAGARTNVALGVGTVTRRAYVGGSEVARSRFDETKNDPAEQAAAPAPRSRLSSSA
jgi:GT2 family glycosyltransferase